MKAQRIDGQLFDIPPAVRCFQLYTSAQRSDLMASHRTGFRQRERLGEFYWIHPLVPDIAFPTRVAALRAALAASR